MKHPNPAPVAELLCDPDMGREFLEDEVRKRMRHSIAAVAEEGLEEVLGRSRYGREPGGEGRKGYRNGHRDRLITGMFRTETVSVPRAWLHCEDGSTREWRSRAFPRYRRITQKAEALIANAYLAGVNTRRVRCMLQSILGGAVIRAAGTRSAGPGTRSRATGSPDLPEPCRGRRKHRPVFLDGTMVNSRVGKQVTKISILTAAGVNRDGQNVLLAAMNMGQECTSA